MSVDHLIPWGIQTVIDQTEITHFPKNFSH